MKKLPKWWLLIILLFITLTTVAQTPTTVERNGNIFTEVKQKTSDIILTDYYYNTGGQTYQVFINKASGRCFINKVSSKTGKTYRYYLPEVICREICREMNIVYVDKK